MAAYEWSLQLAPELSPEELRPATVSLADGTTLVGRAPEGEGATRAIGGLATGPQLSRVHVRCDMTPAGPVLTDNSVNGTTVETPTGECKHLAKGQSLKLSAGDCVTLGWRGQEMKAAHLLELAKSTYRYIVVRTETSHAPPSADAGMGEEAPQASGSADVHMEESPRASGSANVQAGEVVGWTSQPRVQSVHSTQPLERSQTRSIESKGHAALTGLAGQTGATNAAVPPAAAAERLRPAEAAARIGYEDVNAFGCFTEDEGGRRVAVEYSAHERLSSALESRRISYEDLRAFQTADGRGWGVCCAAAIREGQVVVEAVGRCLSEDVRTRASRPVPLGSFPALPP